MLKFLSNLLTSESELHLQIYQVAIALLVVCSNCIKFCYVIYAILCILFKVTRMLAFAIEEGPNSSRRARIKDLNVRTLVPGRILDEVDISDPSLNATGANNAVLYQPRYTDYGVFFINMEEVFPCVKRLLYRYHPVCKIFTHEDDDFQGERSIYEAADSGNHFRIFNATFDIPTYGFGIQGCAEFTIDCIPTNRQFAIICYSPC